MFTQFFGAVKMVYVDFAEFIEWRDFALTIWPRLLEQTDMFCEQLHARILVKAKPWALLRKSLRVLEDTSPDHNAVEFVSLSQFQPVCAASNITVAHKQGVGC